MSARARVEIALFIFEEEEEEEVEVEEAESFFDLTKDWRSVSKTSCRVTPPFGTSCPAQVASTTPPLHLLVCHAARGAGDAGAQQKKNICSIERTTQVPRYQVPPPRPVHVPE